MAAKDELITTLRKEFRDSRSRPTEKILPFITADAVKQVMTKERVRDLLKGLGLEDQEQLSIVWNHSRQILAILVTIKWNGWPKFKEIFLRELDPLGRPRRGDHQLPFLDLTFLEEDVREDFDEAQSLFRPIIIQENKHLIYGERHRLPFLKSRQIGDGGFGVVTEELVERKQIKYSNGAVNSKVRYLLIDIVYLSSNTCARDKVALMARKVIDSTKLGTKSFNTERRNLEQFKGCLSKNDNIMMSFSTFVHGSQFNIISPLADLDLHDFLYGNYGETSQRCTGFTPRALFEEAWCLANALNFLHEQLNLRTGPISCAHMDLKPENILVEGLLPSPNGEMVVGRWKISDFGIAIIRPLDAEAHESRASKEHQLAALGDVIRDISMKPPRPPGPYQAPEMQPQEGLRVSKSSDMWSFGCIIAMILAFAIGGPEKVRQLLECRKNGHTDDYFYMMEGPAVKPNIVNWLKYQAECQNLKEHRQWISECQILILDLLTVKKEDRPSAEEAGMSLLSMREASGRISLEKQKLWGVTKQEQPTVISTSSARDDINSLHSAQSFETDGERTPPNHIPPPMPNFTAPDELRIGQVPFKPLNVNHSSSFIRLETPLNVKKACLSSCGRRAAFLSGSAVYLYQIDVLDDDPTSWKPKSHAKRLDKDAIPRLKTFESTEARQWTSIFLAGPFCALASTSKEHIEDMVFIIPLKNSENLRSCLECLPIKQRIELYDLSEPKYPNAQHVEPIHKVEIPEDFKELKLSSEGIILLQFYDRLEVSSSR